MLQPKNTMWIAKAAMHTRLTQRTTVGSCRGMTAVNAIPQDTKKPAAFATGFSVL